jgi:hypothetical protein
MVLTLPLQVEIILNLSFETVDELVQCGGVVADNPTSLSRRKPKDWEASQIIGLLPCHIFAVRRSATVGT